MEDRTGRRIRRIGLIGVAATVAAAVCIGRLAWLQVLPGVVPAAADLTERAVESRFDRLVADTGRGRIVDRTGLSLVGLPHAALAAFPVSGPRGSDAQYEMLAEAVGIRKDELRGWLDGLAEPAFLMDPEGRAPLPLRGPAASAAEEAGLAGVHVLPYTPRDSSVLGAQHVVGYVSENPGLLAGLYAEEAARGVMPLNAKIGGMGLERSLEKLLRGPGPVVAQRRRNAGGGPLPGALRIVRAGSGYFPLTVRTTLDGRLQRELSALADRAGLKEGAIVVLDAATGDITAMVSRPAYDPLRIAPGLSGTENNALRAAAPGSIFKVVTLAAALDAGVVHSGERFRCDGEYERYGLSCWKEGGHGVLTLEEAFAQSCNVAFAQIAERLAPEQLAAAADRLGFGRPLIRPVRWPGADGAVRPLPEEESGRVFAGQPPAHDGGLIVQTAIGQRDAAASPLQAAAAVVALLHGGRVPAPRIVAEIRYASGSRMAAFGPAESPSRFGRVSPRAAAFLLRGMEAVVREGTGRSMRNAAWPLAGKSGTAQAAKDGRPVNHQWFAGYGPVGRPRYAAAVVALNRPPDSAHQASELFRQVMDVLAAHEESSASVR
jgi:cell division protein FtsI/penicillin-binding protein 2